MTEDIFIIGVGNEFRSDDAAGIEIARRIAAMKLPGVRALVQSGEGAELINSWEGVETLYLVDAVSASNGEGGEIYRFEAHKKPLPVQVFGYSSHALGVPEAIEIARNLGTMPARLIVFGIQGNCFEPGVGLSPMVEQAIDEAVGLIIKDIDDFRSQ